MSGEDLEELFWVCDAVATTRGRSFVPVTLCSTATERLRKEKFGGDFDAFLAWWRENKRAQYLKIANRRRR